MGRARNSTWAVSTSPLSHATFAAKAHTANADNLLPHHMPFETGLCRFRARKPSKVVSTLSTTAQINAVPAAEVRCQCIECRR